MVQFNIRMCKQKGLTTKWLSTSQQTHFQRSVVISSSMTFIVQQRNNLHLESDFTTFPQTEEAFSK